MVWLGAPDQGASQGPVRPVGFERERDQHRGPPTMVWLGAPDQGASQGPVRPVGFERERDQPNILPLDLNFYFNL